MKSESFCYWLQGFFELNPGPQNLDNNQVEVIRRHLAMVFRHEIDPGMGDVKEQAELDQIHGPSSTNDVMFRC